MKKQFQSEVLFLPDDTPVVVRGTVTTSREEHEFWGAKSSNLVDRFTIEKITALETGQEVEVSQAEFEALERDLIVDEIF